METSKYAHIQTCADIMAEAERDIFVQNCLLGVIGLVVGFLIISVVIA